MFRAIHIALVVIIISSFVLFLFIKRAESPTPVSITTENAGNTVELNTQEESSFVDLIPKNYPSQKNITTTNYVGLPKISNEKNLTISTNAQTTQQVTPTTASPVPSITKKMSGYFTYTKELLSLAEDTSAVVIFFHATWCPTCRSLDRNIRENIKNIPAHVTILDLDYDSQEGKELRKKYGVTYQHTFVQVHSDGSQITKWSGSPTLESLLKNIK
ncbi:MAG: thioredoxin family protein [Alphaproteobacteria bacterium]|nr:thioredoxin family protein [Alphaproteobacteria bacterium]